MRLLSLLIPAVLLAFPAIAADVDKGKSTFAKCGVCHTVGPDAKNKVGPQLNGIFTRPVASAPDFNYSQSIKDFAGSNPNWTDDLMNQYLENPKSIVPGGKMAFAGLKKPEDRENVIAYLKTFP